MDEQATEQQPTSDGGSGLKRRGLVLGGLGALAAGLFGRMRSANAQTEPGTLMLGQVNQADDPTVLQFTGGKEESAFKVEKGQGTGILGAGSPDIGEQAALLSSASVYGRALSESDAGAVVGQSDFGYGVWGKTIDGIAVKGWATGPGGFSWIFKSSAPLPWPAERDVALHVTGAENNDGLCVKTLTGTGVMIETQQGVALHAMGPVAAEFMGMILSDMVGSGMILDGSDNVFIPFVGITMDSHVQLTLMSPVRRPLWVELRPGQGFVVHAGQQGPISFTFWVVGATPAR